MKWIDGRSLRAEDRPKPSRSYAITGRSRRCASTAGKSRHCSTLPSESCSSTTGSDDACSRPHRRTNTCPPGTSTNTSSTLASLMRCRALSRNAEASQVSRTGSRLRVRRRIEAGVANERARKDRELRAREGSLLRPLGCVHGLVRPVEQARQVFGIVWIERLADAGVERQRRVLEREAFAPDGIGVALDAAGRDVAAVHLRQDHGELIAAYPCHGVDCTCALAQARGKCLQRRIARAVTEGVVDLLEAVHVEVEHAEATILAPGRSRP